MRIGLGCMRIATDEDADPERAEAVVRAALEVGIDLFDTARTYGESERLLGRLVPASATIVTKCGMRREGAAWVPDGRARVIEADAAASAEALGRAPDVLLLHAPDRAVDLAVTVRALARVRERGLARAVGLSNVTRREIAIASAHAPVEGVEHAFGPRHDAAARGGVLAWCARAGAPLFAHSPLGGPAKAGVWARDRALQAPARRLGLTPAELLLAWLAELGATPIPGARRPETARSIVRAAAARLDDDARAALAKRFPALARAAIAVRPAAGDREVVLVMGLPGAGKSRLADRWVAAGHDRLNRDSLGGTLRGIDRRLADLLAAGARGVVLDNTYTSRASRSDVARIAAEAGARARCVHLDVPILEAENNVVWRMLERHGRLLGGAELARARKDDPQLLDPGSLRRLASSLEPPEDDEGFAAIETVPFVRAPWPGGPGLAVSARFAARPGAVEAIAARGLPGPALVFGWSPRGIDPRAIAAALAGATGKDVDVGVCEHGDGPPTCWCRPPLPGLVLAFARERGVDPRKLVLFAESSADRAIAARLGSTLA